MQKLANVPVLKECFYIWCSISCIAIIACLGNTFNPIVFSQVRITQPANIFKSGAHVKMIAV